MFVSWTQLCVAQDTGHGSFSRAAKGGWTTLKCDAGGLLPRPTARGPASTCGHGSGHLCNTEEHQQPYEAAKAKSLWRLSTPLHLILSLIFVPARSIQSNVVAGQVHTRSVERLVTTVSQTSYDG